ncbi:flagellar hook-associated protein FlgK [Microvirga sp. KLBC 81]|uniref:flagellar hook-associated protein FlgK n=1 Tax=Microvirga sp. KLBC 81 TaxID=1862707 RepID=UPI000D50C6BA|nr:flagellar hook-associated protein FlgK [Microvirga sp. KLBC 81]PVE22488.1 flagellar hook-associated protein FlgK [Microvirga sp. KLBC 81]
MSLSVAYNTARSSLQASQSQMAIVSRNTAGASDPAYSRKIGALVTTGGAARVTVLRASDRALLNKMLETTSDAATQKSLLEGLQRLSQTIGDPELDESPAARIGTLNNALKQYANAPDDAVLARGFVKAASDLAASLNQATSSINAIRQETQVQIADSVSRINDILAKFKIANDEVVSGAALGRDVTDALDTRDSLIAQLSEEIGVTVVPRADNDIALYTDSGVALFDRLPRSVRYESAALTAGKPGGAILIDEIPVTGSSSPMPLNSGNLVGLVRLRDDAAVTYQKQLDELARGLIEAFAEYDKSGGGKPDRAGVFTYSGGPSIPKPAPEGLAGLIKVSDAVDPSKAGGKFERIRDGGINGADYTYGDGTASFSTRLYQLVDAMQADRAFDPSLGLGNAMSLQEFASSSAGWLEAQRQDASQQVAYQETLLAQASEALSNATDVNMDDETALMLQLEKSYSASAKLISVIDQMLQTLLNAVG